MALIDERAGLNVTIDDVSDAAGVSARALQLTFRRHLGVTPMGYARRVRVSHAHRDLEVAAPGAGASVTRIAMDWGFANPSRFASYYRAAYGRPPHETLRSRRGVTVPSSTRLIDRAAPPSLDADD